MVSWVSEGVGCVVGAVSGRAGADGAEGAGAALVAGTL